ncbi:ATPase, histidine kinase-, DNA gyrase B-, and HSP90-like domain protein [Synechococcus sp. PCC 7335]|uniref:sensor histidine kinase n=1 Tax=Synechococcus sp. (strain ATCC 29403 / PCC 7335) TaxID=91464 RepID=UPI00017EB816|nr:ATP-binding protein [Synechococcus sp. PCC 7335]EDX85427.1 ATPase, histidine kinase-, DNA gyrase B-, and HSP90-like domain protein [Synechococcus sp. PCC 7335]
MPESEPLEQRLRTLETENRRLQRKLSLNERNLERWHRSRQQAESLLSKTIHELQTSRATLRHRSQELEKALADLQAMQSRLLMAERMSSLGVLVAGVAHEINNPVSFIYGNVEHTEQYIEDLFTLLSVYQRCYPEPLPAVQSCTQEIELEFLLEDLPKAMQSMRLGAERIRQIVLSLRTFSRMDEAEYKTVDLHDGLDSTLIILAHRLKQKEKSSSAITITKNYGDLPPVACYAGQINQVFMNILVNAIDALEENQAENQATNAEITISTARQENQAIITIADNGPGMDEATRGKIFDPFFTTKPVGKGTGMGMAISYQIVVDKHHGQLLLKSSKGKGTEFTICLPLHE